MTEQQLQAIGLSLEDWNSFGPIEKLYLDVTQRLSELVPDIVWIELEDGQLEIPDDSYPVQFPCALIDFPNVEFENETEGNQQGLLFIQIRLGIDLYEDLYMADGNRTPDAGIAIKRLKLITDAHRALHGFETEYSTGLTRVSVQTERRDDGIKVFALTYGCAAKDDSAASVPEYVAPLQFKFNKIPG